MPQYLIMAEDGNDDDALQRRMTARPDHLIKASKLKASKNFIIGGAVLNEQEKMTGSVMIMEFESEEEVNKWLSEEPYVNGNVWKKITVKRFKVADV
jgi:uncharacterized protein YciI